MMGLAERQWYVRRRGAASKEIGTGSMYTSPERRILANGTTERFTCCVGYFQAGGGRMEALSTEVMPSRRLVRNKSLSGTPYS